MKRNNFNKKTKGCKTFKYLNSARLLPVKSTRAHLAVQVRFSGPGYVLDEAASHNSFRWSGNAGIFSGPGYVLYEVAN